jgi:carbonic anhydrase/acetyltransferase-like protein (isoleucine patch superfamily)
MAASWSSRALAVAIYALGDVEPRIYPTAYVHPDAVVIGEVELGPEASVWPTAVLRGDPGGIVVGARTSIQDGTVVHTTPITPTRIGAECVVGHLVHLEGCTIGRLTLIGSGSIVLNGATVGDEALVAAGALVGPNKDVPSGHRAIGVPARISELASHTNDRSVQGYLAHSRHYRQDLRRIG